MDMSYWYLRAGTRNLPVQRHVIIAMHTDSTTESAVFCDPDIQGRLLYAQIKTGHTWLPLFVIHIPPHSPLRARELATCLTKQARVVHRRIELAIDAAKHLGLASTMYCVNIMRHEPLSRELVPAPQMHSFTYAYTNRKSTTIQPCRWNNRCYDRQHHESCPFTEP